MKNDLIIKPLSNNDISFVTELSRNEGFVPGIGDLDIYKYTDNQGLWVGWYKGKPVGCIAGVRYNEHYGFLGLFIVIKQQRGKGFGLQLWKQALKHLDDLSCIGLEAAPDRINDYSKWGFEISSKTTRWELIGDGHLKGKYINKSANNKFSFLEGDSIPPKVVEVFDEKREASPRPHFLSNWLKHPAGKVIAVLDHSGECHGFGRIRPCLLKNGEGWRIGPLLADSFELAEILLASLVDSHPGLVIVDSPGVNNYSSKLFKKLGFKTTSETFRMYRGEQPPVSMSDVYGLACLELG